MQTRPVGTQNFEATLELQNNKAEHHAYRLPGHNHLVQGIAARKLFDQHVIHRHESHADKYEQNADPGIIRGRCTCMRHGFIIQKYGSGAQASTSPCKGETRITIQWPQVAAAIKFGNF